jgi:amino acid transporter
MSFPTSSDRQIMHPQTDTPPSTVATGGDPYAPSGAGPTTLGRGRLGAGSLVFFTVSASAPMTVLAGGVVATLAVTGIIGTPLSFPILAVVLALFAVGYAAMSRHVVNAGVFYAYISQGLGGAWGVAASFVALISYNAIQIGLYGLFGLSAKTFIDSKTNLTWPWYTWALIAMALVAILGLLRVDLNAKVLAVLLIAEVLAVLLFDIGGLSHPAGGHITAAGLEPGKLFVHGVGVVLAFGIAAFTGFESAGDYAEEAKNPRRTVAVALMVTIAITGVLYTISAWAMTVGYGPNHIITDTRTPSAGVPFSLLASDYNNTIADIANILLLTSVFAALLSFHNTVARYLFAAGRERVLPRFMATTSARTKAPIIGSFTQTATALIVLALFVWSGKDPVLAMFTWLSYISAVGILLLMIGTSIAVLVYLNRHGDIETLWQKTIAPILAIITLGIVFYYTAGSSRSLLGIAPGATSTAEYVLPGIVIAALIAGVIWGAILRTTNPPVYAAIGKGGLDTDNNI